MERKSRVLFVRIGLMERYAGPREGDERPEGGGKHNVENLGHEAFNFYQGFGETLYGIFGIVRAHVTNPKIDLRKIDPALQTEEESLDGVLVIFVAPHPNGLRIVGWYRDATVYSQSVPYPETVRQSVDQYFAEHNINPPGFGEYRIKANRKSAVLLPVSVRTSTPPVPRGEDGMGQSNVCYAYANGVPKLSPWIDAAIEFVNKYRGTSLLDAEVDAEAAAFDVQERAQGFQTDVEVRKVIEEYAMNMAREKLCGMGFRKFANTSAWACYDYTCELDGSLHYVEVKGTQTAGSSVILTKNEVKHAQKHPKNSIAVIVRDVRLNAEKRPHGGTTDDILPWSVKDSSLDPIQYMWTVTKQT
jgi:hypothetical protein